MSALGLDEIKTFDFVEETKRTSLAYYKSRAQDRKQAASESTSSKERDRLLALAKDDLWRVDFMQHRFEEEGIDLETYDPKETEAIVRSLARHIEQPSDKQKEGDEDNQDDNQKMANKLLSLAGQ